MRIKDNTEKVTQPKPDKPKRKGRIRSFLKVALFTGAMVLAAAGILSKCGEKKCDPCCPQETHERVCVDKNDPLIEGLIRKKYVLPSACEIKNPCEEGQVPLCRKKPEPPKPVVTNLPTKKPEPLPTKKPRLKIRRPPVCNKNRVCEEPKENKDNCPDCVECGSNVISLRDKQCSPDKDPTGCPDDKECNDDCKCEDAEEDKCNPAKVRQIKQHQAGKHAEFALKGIGLMRNKKAANGMDVINERMVQSLVVVCKDKTVIVSKPIITPPVPEDLNARVKNSIESWVRKVPARSYDFKFPVELKVRP